MDLETEVARLQRGDLDALSALITRYQNRLYRYLLRLVRQQPEADDLFQQTWMRVAAKIHGYRPHGNFDAWLFAVARNLAIDHLRRVRPESLDEPISEGPAAGSAAERLESTDPTPLDRVLERERAGWVATALAELPAVYREVLSLRFEEEMKLEEIAQLLGTPVSTVKSRLRRSLEQLRVRLETRSAGEGCR